MAKAGGKVAEEPGEVPAPGGTAGGASAGRAWIAAVVLLVAGFLAFESGFEGVFVFDDEEAILFNPQVRALPSVVEAMKAPRMTTLETRPLPSLSLAVNWSLGAEQPYGYHVFNLGVHLLATLLLFGLIRRLLRLDALRERLGGAADGLAFAVALLWCLHPLQTESVTYTVQRVESMMGVAYLATLLLSLRYFTTGRRGFAVGAWLTCLAGMACKEVMVTAPVVVFLMDACLVERRWLGALRRRAGFYAALASTWILLVWLVVVTGARQDSVGFDTEWVAGSDYVLDQLLAWGLYLRLAFWPHPQVFDYGWPFPVTAAQWLPGAALLAALVVGTLWALVKRPALGLAGAAFLLILSPTTTIVPIVTEVYAEHRMYLPLAAVLAVVVVGGYATFGRRVAAALGPGAASAVGWTLLAVAAGLLGWRTHARNLLYHSKATLWADTVAARPQNDRAHNQYGLALVVEGRRLEALPQFEEAVRLRPDYYYWRQSLATCLLELNRVAESEQQVDRVLELKPDFSQGNLLKGYILFRAGKLPEAERHLIQVLEVEPTNANAGQYLTQILETYRRQNRAEDLRRLEGEQRRLSELFQRSRTGG